MNINNPIYAGESSTEILNDSRGTPQIYREASAFSIGYDVRQGTSVPNYKDLILKGGNASSGYTRKGVTSKPGHGSFGSKTPDAFRAQYGYTIESDFQFVFVGQPNPPSLDETETRNRALMSLKRQLASRIGNAQLMAPVAECRELGRLVEQAALLSTNFVKAVVHAKLGKTGKPLKKFLADSWLGFSFALSPLLGDVSKAGKAIADYLARQDIRTRLQGSAVETVFGEYVPSHTISAPFGAKLKARGACTAQLSYRYIGAFDCNISSSNDYSVLEHLGFGLSDIPATLWELTAFSWLFDYFTNVGQYLDDVFYVPPGTVNYLVEDRKLNYSCTHTLEVELIRDWTGSSPNGLVDMYKSPAIAELTVFEFKRTPLLELPHAGLVWKSNQTSAKFAVSKLLNLIAIVAK